MIGLLQYKYTKINMLTGYRHYSIQRNNNEKKFTFYDILKYKALEIVLTGNVKYLYICWL